jgi:hypothetical protein
MSLLRMPKFGPVHSIALSEGRVTTSTSLLAISEQNPGQDLILSMEQSSLNASILCMTLPTDVLV